MIDSDTSQGSANTPRRDDFPFYNGHPATVTPLGWGIVMLAVAAGFAILTAPIPVMLNTAGGFLRAILFVVVPIAALGMVSSGHWRALFRKLRVRDFLMMAGFAILNLIVSGVVGFVIGKFLGADANLAVEGLATSSSSDNVVFFARTFIQLIGEEVITILPFLAVMYLGFSKFKLSRRNAIIAAYLVSTVIFGLVHLPSYNWNLIQCLVVIGTARLVLTIPYMITKNLWVSAGAHILNDWLIFGIAIAGAARAGG